MKSYVVFAALTALPTLAACSSGSSSAGNTPGGPTGDASTNGGEDASYTVPEGGITWDDWGQGFFAQYCVECHGASNPDGLDFGQQSIVVTNKDLIRCGVCVAQDPSWACPSNLPAKQFPISNSAGTNPKPSDGERDEVVAWIDAGCP
jgi:hypothetical protein